MKSAPLLDLVGRLSDAEVSSEEERFESATVLSQKREDEKFDKAADGGHAACVQRLVHTRRICTGHSA